MRRPGHAIPLYCGVCTAKRPLQRGRRRAGAAAAASDAAAAGARGPRPAWRQETGPGAHFSATTHCGSDLLLFFPGRRSAELAARTLGSCGSRCSFARETARPQTQTQSRSAAFAASDPRLPLFSPPSSSFPLPLPSRARPAMAGRMSGSTHAPGKRENARGRREAGEGALLHKTSEAVVLSHRPLVVRLVRRGARPRPRLLLLFSPLACHAARPTLHVSLLALC